MKLCSRPALVCSIGIGQQMERVPACRLVVWENLEMIVRQVTLPFNTVQCQLPGSTMGQVAQNLQQFGLVRNAKLFLIYARFMKMNSRLKVGEYALNQTMTPNEIMAVLASGKSVTRNLTIAEGLSVFDIAEILEKSGVGTKEEFFKLVYDKEFIRSLLQEDLESLEGYLFPETYKITKFESIKSVVTQMVKRFLTVWARYEVLAKQKNWNRNQLITFASIVEKETGAGFERPLVSSVFHNRLQDRMRRSEERRVGK